MAEEKLGVRLQAMGVQEFQSAIRGAVQGAVAQFNTLGSAMGRLANVTNLLPGPLKAGLAVLSLYATAVTAGTKAAAEEELQLKRLEAVLKATGNQAGLTSAELQGMADRLSRATRATEEDALGAVQALSTFGGVGSESFERVLELAQDLSAAGFGNLRENAEKLGRFMQEPVEGANRLNRELGFLTPSLKRAIEEMARSGDVARAAGLGLKALQERVGGAGAAERDTLIGSFEEVKKAWGEVLEAFGRTGPIQVLNETLASVGRSVQDALRPESAGARLSRIEDTAARLRAGGVAIPPGAGSGGLVASARMEAFQDLARRDRAVVEARSSEEEAARNRLLQQADDVSRSLDSQAKKTSELTTQQALLNKAITDSGDPTGAYAAALARIQFQLRSVEDPVQKAIRLLQEEANAISLSGMARARLEGEMRAEQAARERGLALSEAERAAAAAAAEAKYRETRAAEAAKEAFEEAVRVAQQADQDRRDAFERGRKIIAEVEAIGRAYEREAADNEKLIEALRQSNTEYEKQKALLEILAKYRAAGTPLTDPEEIRRAEELADKLGRQREVIDDLKDRYRDMKAAARDFSTAISTAFEDAVIQGKSVHEVMVSLLQDVERMLIRVAFTKPLERQLTSFFESFNPFSFLLNAHGNVFSRGALVPFAHGGVVTQPTVFPLGLMGEAGDEGILPLRRTNSGDLGVQAVGAGSMVKVEVIDQRTAATSAPIQVEQFMSQLGPVVRIIARDEVSRGIEDFSRKGGLSRTLGVDYGIRKPPVSRG